MKVGVIVCARLNSTRLPRKMLADIKGMPLLWHIVNRLQACESLDEIIVAATDSDTEIAEFCKKEDIKYFQGDEQDILGRVYGAAREYALDVVVRVWGDCPLPSPKLIDETVAEFKDTNYQYLYTEKYPVGQNIAVMPAGMLESWDTNLKDQEYRHWFHKWCTEQGWAVSKVSPIDYSKVNLCVDTQDDLDRIREVMEPVKFRIGKRRFAEYWPASEVEVVDD